MLRRSIVLVTPALAAANNGNWHTARRWARLLRRQHAVQLLGQWQGEPADMLIALHARRSAPSVLAWRAQRPAGGLVLVLTGTDLYRDIATDAAAQQALAAADALVVLNRLGPRQLPEALRGKCRVVLQSCGARQPLQAKASRHLTALMVGHLRAEKDPLSFLRAAQRLAGQPDIHLRHIGAALDAQIAAACAAQSQAPGQYRWLGALPRAAARRHIQAAHVLVHASRMEVGAQVVIEALRSGTPVLASRIDGNLGLLGADWPGLFDVGDDAAIAAWLQALRARPDMLADWRRRALALADEFRPEAEAAALLALVEAVAGGPAGH